MATVAARQARGPTLAVFGCPPSTLSEDCRNIRLTQTRNRVEAKVIPKLLFVDGVRQATKKSMGMTFVSTWFRGCVSRMFRQFSLSVDGGQPKTACVGPRS